MFRLVDQMHSRQKKRTRPLSIQSLIQLYLGNRYNHRSNEPRDSPFKGPVNNTYGSHRPFATTQHHQQTKQRAKEKSKRSTGQIGQDLNLGLAVDAMFNHSMRYHYATNP
ncbi:hypothetical protein BC567DRAFT_52672 [Phyllosticta citribraziliensis]